MGMLRIDNQSLLVDESIYSTANGYIGVRGNFEEGYQNNFETIRSSFLNGYYDTHKIKYSESAFGFPTVGETMVDVFDVQGIKLKFNNVEFGLREGKILSLDRTLDVHNGLYKRMVKWQSPNNEIIELTFERMASFVVPEMFIIRVSITSKSFKGAMSITSTLELPAPKTDMKDDPRNASEHVMPIVLCDYVMDQQTLGLIGETNDSKMGVQVLCQHTIDMTLTKLDFGVEANNKVHLIEGDTFVFSKICTFTDQLKHGCYQEKGSRLLENCFKIPVEDHFDNQRKYLDRFWSSARVTIEGDSDIEEALSFSMYQLLASAGKDSLSQIAAKGLSGSGYEGHYFWDTEIYLLPFFSLTQPDIAKSLLKYRYNLLDASKERARTLGHKRGAKIPWRTIAGRECSSYYPAGTAQYHINADVAYANIQYYLLTDDLEMMKEFAFELLYETGLLWLEIGHYSNGKFCMDAVTGPDEYTAIVNNNFYTNKMAKYHLYWVGKLYDLLIKNQMLPITVDKTTIDAMKQASEKMYIPSDGPLNIDLQDDHFIQLKEWDFEKTPKTSYPLLLHFHPLTIYRHQVLKQADTVLAHFLIDDTNDSRLKASYQYYEKRTTHDSSLSACVYGMMASRINQPEKAYDYFMETIYLDIKNTHGNTKDGLHIANAGGAYMAMVYGFAGLRINEHGLSLKPTKPVKWHQYQFRISYKGAQLEITVGQNITIKATGPVSLYIDNKAYDIIDQLEVNYIGKH